MILKQKMTPKFIRDLVVAVENVDISCKLLLVSMSRSAGGIMQNNIPRKTSTTSQLAVGYHQELEYVNRQVGST